jgi:hypothetical protein
VPAEHGGRQAAARRAGLKAVEKLLTAAPIRHSPTGHDGFRAGLSPAPSIASSVGMRMRVKDLDAHVIRTSIMVVLDATRDLGDVAPSEQGID